MSGFLVLVFSSGAAFAEPMPKTPPIPTPLTTISGKVTPPAKAGIQAGAKPEADKEGITIVTTDGTVYTLVKDATTRLLFLDTQFHGREVRLTGKELPGSHVLQVTKVQTVKNGKIFDVDYWCENCQLAAKQPGACVCCGAQTALRELPAK